MDPTPDAEDQPPALALAPDVFGLSWCKWEEGCEPSRQRSITICSGIFSKVEGFEFRV